VDGYRCFFLDSNGHFQDVQEFHAETESDAEQRAWTTFARSRYPRFELWKCGRTICKGEQTQRVMMTSGPGVELSAHLPFGEAQLDAV
jgi:hypothetical protein